MTSVILNAFDLFGARIGDMHFQKLRHFISPWFDRIQDFFSVTRTRPLITASVIAGIAAGFSAYLFERLLSFVNNISFGRVVLTGPLIDRIWIPFFPALGGLITGLIVRKLSSEARGQGVAEVIYAIKKNRSKIPLKTVVAKTLATASTIGTGGSAGPEGPIIQIGGGVGSVVGQLLKLPPNLLRVLVAGGAAGGLAAVFNAPIGGVLFAMEVLLREFVVNAFSVVVISSVSAAVTAHILLGDETFLKTPPFIIQHNGELFLYAGLGILTAYACHFFVTMIHGLEDRFEKWTFPEIWKPAVGGFLVGTLGLFLPQVLGPGMGFMGTVVRGQAGFPYSQGLIFFFLFLFMAKTLGTSLTLGSGGSGGLLTPSLFCGASVGAVFGIASKWMFLGAAGYGSYALIGMAAFFSALSRAPLTAIIVLFELTHDYRVFLPAMIACVLSTLTAQRLNPHSFELLRLRRKGLILHEGDEQDPLNRVEVGSVMVNNVVTISEDLTFDELKRVIAQTHHTGFPVVNQEGLLVGLVTDTEVYASVSKGGDPNPVKVGHIMKSTVRTITPESSLRQAVVLMSDSGQDRLPVVADDQSKRVIGLVSRSHILKVYGTKLSDEV